MNKIISKVLITPVDFDCNMSCGYCYNGSFRQICDFPNKIISIETIRKIFSQITPFLRSNKLVVIWHGGEPLLAGKNFYREAIKEIKGIAKMNGYEVINCLQTNGALIDEEWINLFINLEINPSVSIDGPSYLHNKIRTFSENKPTYELVINNYNLLRNKNINTGLLIVISKSNVNYPLEIWNWILEQKITHCDFLPCVEPELLRKNKQVFSLTNKETADFFIKIFDLWFNHCDPKIRIRTFRDAIKGLLGGQVNLCSWKLGCLHHISFDVSGNAFPCSRYHCYPETMFGNINKMGFTGIMENQATKLIHENIIIGQNKCKNCEWEKICGSGCPFLKYALYGKWDAPYVHCKSRQTFLKHVKQRIFKN